MDSQSQDEDENDDIEYDDNDGEEDNDNGDDELFIILGERRRNIMILRMLLRSSIEGQEVNVG